MADRQNKMVYALRDAQGSIRAVSDIEIQSPGWGLVDGQAPEYLAFLSAALTTQDPFRESDIHLARVLEDLISLLMDRDLIRFTDFPDLAQKRLIERQMLRKRGQKLDIIDDALNLF